MIKILVYLEDGSVTSYKVVDVYKAVEHAFRIVNEGWRNESDNGRWMEYHVSTEVLKVVINVDADQEWTENVTPEVCVELQDGTNLAFSLFFEKSLREFASKASKRGFGYLNNQGDIEVRPKHQVRKIYWNIQEQVKDIMMSKYESMKI
jgi:hypothetical protein